MLTIGDLGPQRNWLVQFDSFKNNWLLIQIIPLHKKGAKDDITNYRPISNLCTMSKIYEKLILQQLLKLAKSNNIGSFL